MLARIGNSWWREAILLVAGELSRLGKKRTTKLIEAIMLEEEEVAPYHNLILAAECVRDAGPSRVAPNLIPRIQAGLRADIEISLRAELEKQKAIRSEENRYFHKGTIIKELIERKSLATQALIQSGTGYWSQPYGEPEWIEIPAGEFIMGSKEGRANETPQHWLYLPAYRIAKVPITNAQYAIFVKETGHRVPSHWKDGQIPKGLESHPVIEVSWDDAVTYCKWLSEATGNEITLPSEAEWEKAAKGVKDNRIYPWGDKFDRLKCNTRELGIETTTSVGIFPDGASPYGVLDMSGNVYEWTRSLWGKSWRNSHYDYPYKASDGREDIDKSKNFLSIIAWRSLYFTKGMGVLCYT